MNLDEHTEFLISSGLFGDKDCGCCLILIDSDWAYCPQFNEWFTEGGECCKTLEKFFKIAPDDVKRKIMFNLDIFLKLELK